MYKGLSIRLTIYQGTNLGIFSDSAKKNYPFLNYGVENCIIFFIYFTFDTLFFHLFILKRMIIFDKVSGSSLRLIKDFSEIFSQNAYCN